MAKWWRVEVSDDSGQIVSIEPEMLAGREIGDAEQKIIENAAFNFLGFIGYGFGSVEFQAGALAMRRACVADAELWCGEASDCARSIASIDPATLKGE